MICCKTETEQSRTNKLIEKQIKKDREQFSKEIKLLLLGTGESGKSTFIKQMRIIHHKGFSEKDKKDFIKNVYENLIVAMQAMIKAMDNLNIKCDDPEIRLHIHQILSIKTDKLILSLDALTVKALKQLWEHEGIQEAYNNRRLFHLSDSTAYFFSHIDRLTDSGYIPTNEDILRVRVQTIGVQEYAFSSKKFNLRITDVAGQRSERPMWFQLFDICNAMIFLSAISEYDQMLPEKPDVNRLDESIKLFGSMVNRCPFETRENILFLNKIDILEEKLQKSNLVDYFPDYEGPERDVMAAQDFIKRKFESQFTGSGKLFVYFTCATDPHNIKRVFKSVRTSIIDKNIGASV